MSRSVGEASLEDIRVIVTRPQAQAQELVQWLAALGAEVLQIPGLEIRPAPDNWAVRQQFQNLDTYQHVIFTSVNAVHLGMQWIDRYWPQWPQGLRCYSVGPGTAKALTAHHIESFLPKNFSSEGLLELSALMSVEEARVLIVKGQGGRSLLKETLEARGALVNCAELYQRVCSKPDTAAVTQLIMWLRQESPVFLLLSSIEIMENLKAQLQSCWNELKKCVVLAVSERVAQEVRKEGFQSIHVLSEPTNAEVIKTLQTLVKTN